MDFIPHVPVQQSNVHCEQKTKIIIMIGTSLRATTNDLLLFKEEWRKK